MNHILTNWLAAIGILTALGGGFGTLASTPTLNIVIYALIGFGGAGLLVLAIYLRGIA